MMLDSTGMTIPGGDDRYTDPDDYRTQEDEGRAIAAAGRIPQAVYDAVRELWVIAWQHYLERIEQGGSLHL